MKRLAWLLLAVFCMAAVRVQPVGRLAMAKTCHCSHPGACGMPGCCPQPSSARPLSSPAESVRESLFAASREAKPACATEKFYLSFVEPGALRPASPASANAAHAVGVPLFRAHCSLLI